MIPERPGRRSALHAAAHHEVSWSSVARVLLVVAVGITGALIGLFLVGPRHEQIGPLSVQVRVVPSFVGDTVIDLPPLGTVSLDTHDGPLSLHARVEAVDVEAARSLLGRPDTSSVEQDIIRDARTIVWRSALQGIVGAVLGAGLLVLVVWRRPRRALLTALVTTAVCAASLVVGGLTWNQQALAQPRYTGLLVYAPQVVGDADQVVSNVQKYGDQLARLVDNVSKLSAAVIALPQFEPNPETVRVLHVSDIHLNPNVWPIMRTIVKQYGIDMVVDSGDIADHGTAAEVDLLDGIRTLGVPYVYVRGNHDSASIESAIAAMPNAVVLRGGVADVEGLQILGSGDPRFTPDKSTTQDSAEVVAQGEKLAAVARAQQQPVDFVVVHDPTAAPPLAGVTPLVLAGHTHQRRVEDLGQGTELLVQGSTGGAGLRALESEEPTPLTFTVLYFDRATGALQARDEITLGGVGLTSAQVERFIQPQAQPQPAP